MLAETIYSLGNPGTFDITDKDDPMYYVARLAHEISVDRYNLNDAGFEYRQDELSDFTSIASDWDTWVIAIQGWLDAAVIAQEAGTTVPAIPTIPSIPSDPVSAIAIQLLFRIAGALITSWLKKRFEGGTDTGELVHLLGKALLDGDGESLLYLLHAVPLEIIFNRQGEYQDFLYSDTP